MTVDSFSPYNKALLKKQQQKKKVDAQLGHFWENLAQALKFISCQVA